MRVLLSNDDGIHAPGMRALAARLAPRCELIVVCPEGASSASSHTVTLHKPLRLHHQPRFAREIGHESNEHLQPYSCSGQPSDCVTLGVEYLAKDNPVDLVISGINDGRNIAEDLSYSGTIGAALEGAILGVPSIALSYDVERGGTFEQAAELADLLLSVLLFGGVYGWHSDTLARLSETARNCDLMHAWRLDNLPELDGERYPKPDEWRPSGLGQTPCLNVNIPGCNIDEIRCFQWTVGGHREYHDPVKQAKDPRGRPYFWLGGERMVMETERENTDTHALFNQIISVTPISYDLTNYLDLERYHALFEERRRGEGSQS